MKYIEVIDTAYFELLKSDLNHILSNQEDYDSVWDAMMDTIEEHGAERICPDFSLEW